MDYNTTRGGMPMREYGRHLQNMVSKINGIEDPAKRLKYAEGIIDLMAFMNPGVKISEDYRHMLWDHLHCIGDFKLEVEGPYPKPEEETYFNKPEHIGYPLNKPKYNHLGRHIENVINKALVEPDPEKKSDYAHAIAHYMKIAYSTWHKELVPDDTIRQELDSITNGELTFTNTPYVHHRANGFKDEGLGLGKPRTGGNNKFKSKNRNQQANQPNNNNRKFNKYPPKKRF